MFEIGTAAAPEGIRKSAAKGCRSGRKVKRRKEETEMRRRSGGGEGSEKECEEEEGGEEGADGGEGRHLPTRKAPDIENDNYL